MLLLAAQFVETGKTRVAEQMPDEMGGQHLTRGEEKSDDRVGRKNGSFHRKNGRV